MVYILYSTHQYLPAAIVLSRLLSISYVDILIIYVSFQFFCHLMFYYFHYHHLQVHPYLARDCSYSSDHPNNANVGDGSSENNGNSNNEVVAEVGGHDTEKQNVQVMKFSEVKKAVMDGKFVEVQWSNTVALAMLHLSFPLEGEVVE